MPASDAWWPQGKRVYNTDLEYLKLFNEAAGARSQKEVSPECQYIFTYIYILCTLSEAESREI